MLLGITRLMIKLSAAKKVKITFKGDAHPTSTSTTGVNDGSSPSIVGRRVSRHTSGAETRQRETTDTMSMLTFKPTASVSQSHMSLMGSLRGGAEARISYLYRAEMCNKDMDAFEAQIRNLRQVTIIDLRAKAALNESLRMDRDESIKTLAEFHNFVHVTGKQVFGKAVPLEHYLSFVENWINNGTAMIEQIRLRTTTLRISRKQKQQELAIKQELSGILRPIDFEQMQIEKVQLLKELDYKQAAFIGLKLVASEVAQAMVAEKKQMDKSEAAVESVRSLLAKRHDSIERYDALSDQVNMECGEWVSALHKMRRRKSTHQVPTIDEYIASKRRRSELEEERKVLQRKLNISVIQLKGLRSKLAQMSKQREHHARKRAKSAARFEALRDATISK